MLQGTSSSVGKSLLVAALCRIFRQDGYSVAPFKAQNMALNAAVTADGLEIGRAQAMQAEAAGIEPTVEMNPVLLKPEGDLRSQVIVRGRPAGHLGGGDYLTRRAHLWGVVTEALDRLRAQHEIVVVEGAGSPAEINLRAGDIVNMRVARYAGAPVLLVGDIDRGGVFAALVGTLALLEPDEAVFVKGFLINKFRGHRALLDPGLDELERRTGVPVLGVIPYLSDLHIADEDSVSIERSAAREWERESGGEGESRSHPPSPTPPLPRSPSPPLHVAVIRLPRIANFDDFDLLTAEPAVLLRYVFDVDELGVPDLVILPGSKATIGDLQWLRECGLAARIVELASAGTPVLGICGGYQMLGASVADPDGLEGIAGTFGGLGLLPVRTVLTPEKRTRRVRLRVRAAIGPFGDAYACEGSGYEIHAGRTWAVEHAEPGVALTAEPAAEHSAPFEVWVPGEAPHPDGCITAGAGVVAGTYVHGLFENAELRRALVAWLARRRGFSAVATASVTRESEYERLAAAVRKAVDLAAIYRLLGL